MEWVQVSKKLSNPKVGWNFWSQTQQHWKWAQIKAQHIQRNKSSTISSHSKRVKNFLIKGVTIMWKILLMFWLNPTLRPPISFILSLSTLLFLSFQSWLLMSSLSNINFGLKTLFLVLPEDLLFLKKMDLQSGIFIVNSRKVNLFTAEVNEEEGNHDHDHDDHDPKSLRK